MFDVLFLIFFILYHVSEYSFLTNKYYLKLFRYHFQIQVKGRDVGFQTTKEGEFWRMLLPGIYTMEVFAEGYQPREVQFAIVEQNPTLLNITLFGDYQDRRKLISLGDTLGDDGTFNIDEDNDLELEDKILLLLSERRGNLLDDVHLIETLQASKEVNDKQRKRLFSSIFNGG